MTTSVRQSDDCRSVAGLRVAEHARLAYIMRAGLVESVHYGSVVVVAPDGSVRCAVGDPYAACCPRSALKPVQTTALVRLGLTLPPNLLALATSSHAGEPAHIEGVNRILARYGLNPSDLRNPADLPLGQGARDTWLAAGRGKARLAHPCSGKHAAMLATTCVNGWKPAGYLTADHPLQLSIAQTVEELADESIARIATDGCGAPLYFISLAGLARAIGRIASAPTCSKAGLVATAMREHPDMVSGSTHPVSKLMRAVPGLIAKDGFEGVHVAALADGSAVAVKIADGSSRATMAVTAAALRLCDVEADALAPFLNGADQPVTDGLRLVPHLTA